MGTRHEREAARNLRSRPRRRHSLPIAAITVLFPTAGNEPYEPWALDLGPRACAAIVAIALLALRQPRAGARRASRCVAIGSFVVPTALGGNVSRLDQYVAGPLLACTLLPRRRLAARRRSRSRCSIWQWFPAVDGIAFARTDPSTHAAYYTPVARRTSAVADRRRSAGSRSRRRTGTGKPRTRRRTLLLARGWERQLDIAYNPIFYNAPLTAATYHTWLHANGVKYVALPDARLDDSSLGERALITSGLPYLHEVWHNAHWHGLAASTTSPVWSTGPRRCSRCRPTV